jgi:hypothetical protein
MQHRARFALHSHSVGPAGGVILVATYRFQLIAWIRAILYEAGHPYRFATVSPYRAGEFLEPAHGFEREWVEEMERVSPRGVSGGPARSAGGR